MKLLNNSQMIPKKWCAALLLGSVWAASEPARAQTTDEPVSPGQQLIQQFGGWGLLAGETAVGTLSALTQTGDRNTAQIVQVGTGLSTTIAQTGDSNTATSTVTGTDVTSDIVQRGSLNVVEQRLTVDQRSYSVLQQGTNNQLTQTESGGAAAGPGYKVEMVGNGIKMNIQQGNIVTGVR